MGPWLKVLAFVLASAALGYFSRNSLRRPRSHGFYRWLAWEWIAAAVILNLDGWFANPLAWYQVISWCLLALSVFLAVHAVSLLRQVGRPDPRRPDEGLIGVEKTTQLVTVGAYRYIRHPMYSSLLCFAWGAFFKSPGWLGGLFVILASLFLTLTAKAEEAENLRYFGASYQVYQAHTRMFVPYLF